ncbi:uncharacterized protein BO66DRAFT_394817 [Aspergillus aculeatinus CBS 121060]|uniref:Uncharacterized protein n=1 Tax=Aspergillus aculeatinus CBS 121060 TaxID=1448322 RepID=A0ACD1GXP8_9EURO|nr:hypothetical protein BO66DRAFT_394817 [Aspergillus aculeatinus CBS 121060]RAH66111.1 hypothetical protein BO66DRAFT_394817 [Aspergillus aculeatinus CBS 121060]
MAHLYNLAPSAIWVTIAPCHGGSPLGLNMMNIPDDQGQALARLLDHCRPDELPGSDDTCPTGSSGLHTNQKRGEAPVL